MTGSPGPTESSSRRVGILAICCMSLFIVGLDNTIVNVALPSIGREFHATVSGLQWTVDAYTLVVASLLMLSGSTADRLGRRRVFQVGLLLFTLGSLACSLAPSLSWLIAFRMMQAVGGSMLNPVALSIIRNTFHDPRERAQAIGIWGAVFGISMALGPVAGGLLVQSVGWRSIFWVNIPVGLAAVALTAYFVPESRGSRSRRPDPIGQLLIMAALASLTYGIIEGPRGGWASPLILSLFLLALASLALLVAHERRMNDPLIEMRFFASAPFSGITVIAIVSFAGLAGFLFLNTLYLQDVRHLSALGAGLDTLPMPATMVLVAPLSGRLVGRSGARPSLLLGGAGIAVGTFLLSGLRASTSFPHLFLAYVVFGVGIGLVNTPLATTAVSGMPASQAGAASAVASTSRQVGQSLGVAVTGAIAVGVLGGGSIGAGFADATHPAWLVLTACGAFVVALGLVTTTPWANRTARRTAERFGLEDVPVPTAPVSGAPAPSGPPVP